VVEQGLWQRLKSMRQTAVRVVQPPASSSARRDEVSSLSNITPAPDAPSMEKPVIITVA
jgi:hypothetical protein